MKIAIIGSRDYPHLDEVGACVRVLANEAELAATSLVIVSGGAIGVDQAAEAAARWLGVPVEIYLPDYVKYGRKAPFVRNRQIIDAADRVIAFRHRNTPGTGHAVRYARLQGKPVENRGQQEDNHG